MLIGGDFITVNGAVRPRVARLYGDSAAPALQIGRSGAFVTISWPTGDGNFHLQENANVSVGNSWSDVLQSRTTNNGNISVTVPANAGSRFYRLSSQ